MDLKPPDLHFVFDKTARRIKAFDAAQKLVWSAEMRNSTVADGQYGHWGNIPPGEYLIGTPQARHTAPFGRYFTPIGDYHGHHGMADHGRVGIGIHGGGSGLPDPLAPHQGWVPTEGCGRLANADNEAFVAFVRKAQAEGGRCYLTVTR